MANSTPTYGLRYQEVGDSPNGAVGLQNLATDVETALTAIDAKIATINALATAAVTSTTDEIGFSNTTFAAGSSPVGSAFTAPPSGAVLLLFSAQAQQNINAQAVFVSIEVKTGGTVGSGTLAGTAANSDRAIITGKAVNASAPALIQAGRPVLYTGLTQGATYNARLMHCVDGGSGTISYREIIIQPQL